MHPFILHHHVCPLFGQPNLGISVCQLSVIQQTRAVLSVTFVDSDTPLNGVLEKGTLAKGQWCKMFLETFKSPHSN